MASCGAIQHPVDVLMFVEDPGAANYIAPLLTLFQEKGLSSRLLTSGKATEYLCQRGILSETDLPSSLTPGSCSLLLVGTSENPETPAFRLIDQCRTTGICTVGVVDAYANAAYRFRGQTQNPLAHAPDWLIVPDSRTQDAFLSLGYPADRILIGGHPHYDSVRAEQKRLSKIGRESLRRKWLPDAGQERVVLVFVAEISTGMDPAEFQRSGDYSLYGWGVHNGRTEIVLEEFLDAVSRIEPRPYIVLRLHPKNSQEEFARYRDAIDLVSRGGLPLELVYAADGVIGMTSMLLLEAALLDRPTLSIVPRACEQEWLPTTSAGFTPTATSRAEICRQLSLLMTQSNRPTVTIDTLLPADCSERVAAFVCKLLTSTAA